MIDTVSPGQIAHTDARIEILLFGIATNNGFRTFDIRSTYILPNRLGGCLCS
ncbi:hypothetical protein BJV78DRAFT_1249367 [Lactifluus subvellereus]|nr:hypothetical protein BJV78DRAFT_1249367 [Lactifluus subvellereus]